MSAWQNSRSAFKIKGKGWDGVCAILFSWASLRCLPSTLLHSTRPKKSNSRAIWMKTCRLLRPFFPPWTRRVIVFDSCFLFLFSHSLDVLLRRSYKAHRGFTRLLVNLKSCYKLIEILHFFRWFLYTPHEIMICIARVVVLYMKTCSQEEKMDDQSQISDASSVEKSSKVKISQKVAQGKKKGR